VRCLSLAPGGWRLCRWLLAGGACLTLAWGRAVAQEAESDFTLEGLFEQADVFLNENLRGGELHLPEPDPVQLEEFLRSLQAQLEGEYVLDLVPFKRVVDFLLPLLEAPEAPEDLRDLGAWLRARRDYFDVIDELTLIVPPPLSPPSTNAPGATNAGAGPGRTRLPDPNRGEPAPLTNAPSPAVALTNRVTVEVVDREEDEEPVPIEVVIVPQPAAPVRPPPAAAPATNRLVAVVPPRPPTTPALRRENPAPEAVRSAWARRVAGRDWPAGARQWVAKLKPIFVAEGVPAELVWLAEVESGFDPRARSPAGAVGLYQLMPVTARSLGLSSFPFDQRKSPEKAARAAAQYLRQLYGQFGDWPLALAAYNAGPTRVRSLLTAHRATTFGGIARRLPVETQLYVPKFDAVLQLREGRALKDLRPLVLIKDPAAAEGPSPDP